ncbi:MAG: hypothetical protein ND807_00615 [Vicinamibacterales bacterium]|nr:hypothetical protein [Vicinamibacterales bacterium]
MVDQLYALATAFNRGSLDVPAGFLTPRTTFSLNGRSYESMLGGSPDDPLIRLLARGVGGYRTAAKALQYALQQPTITVVALAPPDERGVQLASLLVQGRLRNTNEPFDGIWSLGCVVTGDELAAIDVVCSEEDLERIAEARR